jgi:hypothetical protein
MSNTFKRDNSVGAKERSPSGLMSLVMRLIRELSRLFQHETANTPGRRDALDASESIYEDRENSELGEDILRLLYRSNGEYTFPLLFEKLHPESTTALTSTLADLVWNDKIKRIIRVESPSGGGIKDFGSIEEVPNQIFDWRTDQTLRVRPNNLVTIFRANSSPVQDRPALTHEQPNARKRA